MNKKDKKLLMYYSNTYSGEWDEIANAIKNKEQASLSDIRNTIMDINSSEYNALTTVDKTYPRQFKVMRMSPFVLYYKGDIDLLNKNLTWLYSETTKGYEDIIYNTIDKCKKNNIIPIIGNYHKTEIDLARVYNGKMIIVKSSGINSNIGLSADIEQSIIANGGLIISEYPHFILPSTKRWNRSNNLKANLANNMLLINSKRSVRTFTSTTEALASGTPVFALSESQLEDSKNEELIANGAHRIKLENLGDLNEN